MKWKNLGLMGNIRSDHPNVKATLDRHLFNDQKSITKSLLIIVWRQCIRPEAISYQVVS